MLGFKDELRCKVKPTATGAPCAMLTAAMSGRIDTGWSATLFGLQQVKEGKVRIIARGSAAPADGARSQSVPMRCRPSMTPTCAS